MNVYESKINNNNDFKRAYKFTLYIIKTLFIKEYKRYAKNIQEYKEFLKKKDIDQNFINIFFDLPKNNYKGNNKFIDSLVIYNINLLESIYSKLENNSSFTIKKDLKNKSKFPKINNFIDKLKIDKFIF